MVPERREKSPLRGEKELHERAFPKEKKNSLRVPGGGFRRKKEKVSTRRVKVP